MNTLKAKLLQKSNLWHAGAVGLFLLISIIFFYPALSGFNVVQGDVTNYTGMSQEIKDYHASEGQIGWTNSMFSGMPATQISMQYPGRTIPNFLREAYRLWLPVPISLIFIYFLSFYIMALSFKVKPYIAIIGAIAFGLSSSQMIIIEAGHITKAIAIGYAPLMIAGLIFAYRWKNWVLGVALSALFMTFEISANHLQITYYMAFILIGLGIVELVRHLKIEGGMIKFAKITGGLLFAYSIALLVNWGNISGTSEYAKYTTRGGTDLTIDANGESNAEVVTEGLDKEYITAWSYGKGETFTFLVPNFKGGETMRISDNEDNDELIRSLKGNSKGFVKEQNQYWGDQPFTSGPVYLGVIVVFLALLALVYSEDKSKWALLVVTLITVMLSWGKNFMGFTDLFLNFVPGYSSFRAVTIILAVAQLCVPLLGVLFLQQLIKEKDKIKARMTPFFVVSAALGFVFLVFLAIPTLANDFTSEAEKTALAGIEDAATAEYYSDLFADLESTRISIFRKDVMRSFAFLAISFGLLFAFLKGAIAKYGLAAGLALLILFDLGGVDKRYLGTEKKGKTYMQWAESWKQTYPYAAGNGDLEIFNAEVQKNPNILFAVDSALNANDFDDMEPLEKKRATDWVKFRTLNRYTNYRVFDLANPFNSSYASYFHKSIGGYHGAKLGRYQDLIEFHIGKSNPSVLDMLNMRYQIASQPGPGGQMNSQFVSENKTAMGNAWFTKSVKKVANADEEIAALNSQNAVKMKIGQTDFQVLLNKQPVTGDLLVTGTEELAVVNPIMLPDGTITLDTVVQPIPVREVEAFDLSLIVGQEPGTWNWAYDQMLDTSMKKIITISKGGRVGWDPRNETIVGADYISNISKESYSGEGTITMTSYNPDELVYSTSSNETQLAVFSEIFYPIGWKAYVDDKETPISRVNYTLRAVEVPAGDHVVKLVYKLPSFEKSGTIAWIGSILIVLLVGFGIFIQTKMKEDVEGVDDLD